MSTAYFPGTHAPVMQVNASSDKAIQGSFSRLIGRPYASEIMLPPTPLYEELALGRSHLSSRRIDLLANVREEVLGCVE
jgi:hypothetical protein